MNILDRWREKYSAGMIRFDPDIRIIGSSEIGEWGTVYYSPIREIYKSEVKSRPSTTFDLDLMARMNLFDYNGLHVAANPNSLFEGHLVVYPKTKARELTRQDLVDISELADANQHFAFIHNAERSAASIVDWVHFQAYAMRFPLADTPHSSLITKRDVTVSVVAPDFPAYAMRIEGGTITKRSDLLFRITEILASDENPHRRRIPLNFIWIQDHVWVIPRGLDQSERASRYFGGLEMGGIFCLPNRSEESSYTREILFEEVKQATLRADSEEETARWFEQKVQEALAET